MSDKPIPNDLLQSLAGVSSGAVEDHGKRADLSFALDDQNMSRIVLRAKWETGRRFELARLLGDRLASCGDGKLWPATNARTYRQQMQRSFAAEFLCPFDTVTDLLNGDFSVESREEVARHFSVSEYTVRTLLVNNGYLDRDDLEGDPERMAAA